MHPVVLRPMPACLVGILLLAAAAVPALAGAQEYPTRPIRLIVGFVPGGIADLLARSLGQKLTEAWSQQVIVDNRPGAGGMLSMQLAAAAAPDGHTLLLGSSTQFSITPAVRASLSYHPIRDYTPVTRVATSPVVLTVQAAYPARSIQELIQLARAKPGVMSYGSTGYGGAPHIAAELLKRTTGMQATHVPYKGGSEAVTALLGGHVQMSFGAVSTALPHLKSGRLRALGVTSTKRLSATPDVPTFVEAGLPDFVVDQWYGVFAPARVPPAVTGKLNGTLAGALGNAQFRDQFTGQGIELASSTPEVFAAYVKSELARWTQALKEMGIGPE